jgi:cytochrome c553
MKILRHVALLSAAFGWLLASCDDPAANLAEASPSPAAPPGAASAGGVSPGGAGVYAQVCAACHGVNGEGKEELHSPSITGLPTWYLEEQVRKFRAGSRGFHPEDAPGQQMRAISLTLNDAQIAEAAATVAAMPIRLTEPPPPGFDLETARYRYANECMECHRYNGKGEIVFHSAPLISLNRSYLRRQLMNYRGGRRGATEGDLYGAKMVENMKNLSDEEIELFVNYIGALAHGDDPRGARER